MAYDLSQYDLENVPDASFDPIPDGEYLAAIVESEDKKTKDERGSYLQLKIEILEGEYKGRILWERLNLKNANELARKIAASTLKSICRAIGNMAPRDSVELHDVPFLLRVGHEKRTDNGDLTNRIKGYRSRSEAKAMAPTPDVAPWKKKKAST
jgi:hypothetical protein